MEGQNNIKETGGCLWDERNDDTPKTELGILNRAFGHIAKQGHLMQLIRVR